MYGSSAAESGTAEWVKLFRQSQIEIEGGQRREAAQTMRGAIELKPDAVVLRLGLADALMGMGDLRGARAEFNFVKELVATPLLGPLIKIVDGALALEEGRADYARVQLRMALVESEPFVSCTRA